MTLAITITPAGIIAPTYAEILASLQSQLRAIFGSDIYIEPDSQDGQMLAIFAQSIKDNNDAMIAAYNAFSPTFAQGAGLSSVVKINGIQRLVATNSQANLTITGTFGTPIVNGVAKDIVGNLWALPPLVVIPIAGTIDVTGTAITAGAVAASPGDITQIATPVRGWQTVTNVTAAIPGQPVEVDATLRKRQSESTALPALSVLDSILAAILNLTGVTRAYVYENDTGTEDVDTIPAHSIAAVVGGGQVIDIATAIQRHKTPGTGTYGTTSQTVTDSEGISTVINYFALATIKMAVLIFLTPGTGFVITTEDLIEASLIEWFNTLAIGADSILNKLWSPVNLAGDAATTATGLSQAQLDVLSATYNATALFQARDDGVSMSLQITANPGDVTLAVFDASYYVSGKTVAAELDDSTYFIATITSIVGNTLHITPAVTAGRTIANGNIVYSGADVKIAFNEAALGDLADITVVTP
jgi:uncharacterized phage protein gp47/JayE